MAIELPFATITKRVNITEELWVIWIKPDTPFNFKPGQYCTIGVDGIERAYSIVSSPHEDEIELFIELVPAPEGQLTPLLHRLEEGSKVTIRPRAKGLFTFKEAYTKHLMMSTVTGVVPYVSILRDYIYNKKAGHKFYVLQGASYVSEFTYDNELTKLASEWPDFITYIPTISRPNEEVNKGWDGETGRVNALLEKYLKEFELGPEETLIYACGHPGMIEDLKEKGTPMGYEVHEERFWKE